MFQDLGRSASYLGNLLGIPVFLHWTAAFLVLWSYLWAGATPVGASTLEWLIITLIALVIGLISHELGHALAWRMFGAQSITIFLTGFGGLCVSQRGQESPGRDSIIVAAGPFANLCLLFLFLYLPGWLARIDPAMLGKGGEAPSLLLLICEASFRINTGLFFINMLPIYPLDGGRLVFSGTMLVTRRRLLARQVALFLSVFGALAYFFWSTGLFGILHSGGSVGAWIGTLGGGDVLLGVMLFLLVSGAWRDLR